MEHHQRSCIACRRREDKSKLWRVVIEAGAVVRWDLKQRLPGRGVYIHPTLACVQRFGEGGSGGRLARAFRIQGDQLNMESLVAVRGELLRAVQEVSGSGDPKAGDQEERSTVGTARNKQERAGVRKIRIRI